MQRNVEFKDFTAPKSVRRLMDNRLARIEKKTASFPPDALFLRLMAEENSARTLYRVSITLEVPGKTLAAREERHDLGETIRDAFAEIERQLDAHKASLRGEPAWKRRPRREELRKLHRGVK